MACLHFYYLSINQYDHDWSLIINVYVSTTFVCLSIKSSSEHEWSLTFVHFIDLSKYLFKNDVQVKLSKTFDLNLCCVNCNANNIFFIDCFNRKKYSKREFHDEITPNHNTVSFLL